MYPNLPNLPMNWRDVIILPAALLPLTRDLLTHLFPYYSRLLRRGVAADVAARRFELFTNYWLRWEICPACRWWNFGGSNCIFSNFESTCTFSSCESNSEPTTGDCIITSGYYIWGKSNSAWKSQLPNLTLSLLLSREVLGRHKLPSNSGHLLCKSCENLVNKVSSNLVKNPLMLDVQMRDILEIYFELWRSS